MLKYLAILAMVVDHVPHFFDVSASAQVWSTFVGRMAMPIFCYLVGLGAFRTTSMRRYFVLLVIFGVLSQPLNVVAFDRPWWAPNVLFTLALGLVATRSPVWCAASLALSTISEYGPAAVGLIVCVYVAGRTSFFSRAVLLAGVFFVLELNGPLVWDVPALMGYGLCLATRTQWGDQIQRLAPRGPRLLFYAFYPAHLAVLMLLAPLIAR